MARFEVFANPGAHAATTPYLLDVQSDLLDEFDTRVVVPLRKKEAKSTLKFPQNLMPTLVINGDDYVMETTKLAAVPGKILREPIARLKNKQLEITAALDFLFHGY